MKYRELRATEDAHIRRRCVVCHHKPEPMSSEVNYCCVCGKPLGEPELKYDDLLQERDYWQVQAEAELTKRVLAEVRVAILEFYRDDEVEVCPDCGAEICAPGECPVCE